MATVYPTSNLVGTSGLSVSSTPAIASGDRVVIGKDIAIVATINSGISASGFSDFYVENHGFLSGNYRGIQLMNSTTTADYQIYNAATGIISTLQSYAIIASGASLPDTSGSRASLVNAGEITTAGTSHRHTVLFNTIETVKFANTGSISTLSTGLAAAILFSDVDVVRGSNAGFISTASQDPASVPTYGGSAVDFYNATADVVFHNTGLISAPLYSVASTATTRELITNSGTLEGDVLLSNTIGGVLQNSGAIWGDVDLRAGDDDYRGYGTGFVSGTVFGGAGDDTLIGSAADDKLDGGNNADILRGKRGDDTLLGGADGDRLYGDEGADRLQGDAGNDTLSGGDGEDTIVGGNGLDVLFGGAGADTFTYNSFADSANGGAFDRIRDFTPGEDKINLSSVASGLDFVTGAFTGTGPEVRVQVTSAGVPLVFVDYNGDAVADMRIALLGTTEPVTESDFIL